MSNRRYFIYDRSFSEYVYRCMKSATVDQKKRMSAKDLVHMASESAMNRFVHEESLDRLLTMITKLGKEWTLRVFEEGQEEKTDELEFNSLNQYQFPEKRIELINVLAKEKVHYLSSRHTMLAIHMCDQNVHSQVYALSANSRDAIKRVRAITSVKLSFNDMVDSARDAMDDLNKILLQQLNSLEWAEATLGLSPTNLQVLSALFAKRDTAITIKEIAKDANMEHKIAWVKKSVWALQQLKLIVSDDKLTVRIQKKRGVAIRNYYMITSAGIGKMMEYRNHVHTLAFNPI